ncbi:S24 family peptidase [Sphingomicrobium sediminis]|uniref:Peptidase S24 n=1 Tax=Sphingomicrobium sediminis TaxID=2950949 RepID=A0A9X2J0P6_9SPHN|nr:S24 family peptidase [Sphingomicrobium sediminis]MCM8556478.1 peptidase S24 [Sphingomicrobium sediminis]
MPNDPRDMLEELCRRERVDFATLSRLIGRNDAYIQQYIRRGTPRVLAERDRRLIARYFDIDEERLGAPKRDMPGGLVPVVQRPVRAAAGDGAVNGDDQAGARFAFDRRWLRQLTAGRPEDLSVIRVEGDSMAPTLNDGDDILVDQADGEGRLRDGIYVLRIDDALVVKRLAKHPMGARVTVQSDNPAYTDWPDCKLSDISIIGRVLWIGRRLG